jgi:hypothetical protein
VHLNNEDDSNSGSSEEDGNDEEEDYGYDYGYNGEIKEDFVEGDGNCDSADVSEAGFDVGNSDDSEEEDSDDPASAAVGLYRNLYGPM